ncbi:MAG: YegP family protein [Treponema sp.]|nr:YegP family protein [Treponema sp.]
MAAKFVVYYDKAKKFRFRLLASNGEIIASGEAYESKASCLNGIKSIQKNAPIAPIVDETIAKEPKKADAKKGTKKAPAKKEPAKKAPAKKAAPKKEEVKKEPEKKEETPDIS